MADSAIDAAHSMLAAQQKENPADPFSSSFLGVGNRSRAPVGAPPLLLLSDGSWRLDWSLGLRGLGTPCVSR